MRLSDRNISVRDMIKDGMNAKWKIIHLFFSILFSPFYRLLFLIKGVKWGRKWRLYGMPVIHKYRKSNIQIGNGFTARSWYSSNPLGISNRTFLTTLNSSAKIIIGDNVGISGTIICAADEINISENTLIGANTKIFDNDFHSLNYKNRRELNEEIKAKGIFIGKNVLIGTDCLILKGVKIGDNSVIGAGSIVINDVDSNSLFSGNPAKFIKNINFE